MHNLLREKKGAAIAWCKLSIKRLLFCDLVQFHIKWGHRIVENWNPGELDTKFWHKIPLLLEWGREIHFSCVCVVETLSLLLFLCLLILWCFKIAK